MFCPAIDSRIQKKKRNETFEVTTLHYAVRFELPTARQKRHRVLQRNSWRPCPTYTQRWSFDAYVTRPRRFLLLYEHDICVTQVLAALWSKLKNFLQLLHE